MKRYLLDTQAAVWLLTNNKELPKNLREEIEYVQSLFHVSYMSIVEIIHLQQCGKIDLPLSGRELLANFDRMNVYTLPLSDDTLVGLSMLEIDRGKHSDPFDRAIIATAISRGLTLISSDNKFPWYAEHCGLQLLEI